MDPLTPTLFTLAIETLSVDLGASFDNWRYIGYGKSKWSANINHLAYANEIIIFVSTNRMSLKMIMDVLQEYETVLGQLFNKEKSCLYMFNKIVQALVNEVEHITKFEIKDFPFNYLGCTIFHSSKKKVYYNNIIKKVKNKLQN